jgi:hypothetical protein
MTSRNSYFQIPFLICVGVLALSAAGMKAAMNWMGIHTRKEPIPLQKSLDDLDPKCFGNVYQIVQKNTIKNADVLQSLGTKDYIEWVLQDTTVGASSPVRFCSLFITYYTGNPDQVPHVPEECYVGGGNIKKDDQALSLRLTAGTGPAVTLPVRRLVFASKTANVWDPEFSVQYFFKANGEYADGRGAVRKIMAKNFTCKYSYFSKVEWKFSGTSSSPSVDEIVTASEKLMSVLVPALETQHWPDWDKAKQDSASKR